MAILSLISSGSTINDTPAADGLVTIANDDLSLLLANRIRSVQFVASDRQRRAGANLNLHVLYDEAGQTITDPYKIHVIEEASAALLQFQVSSYLTANPTYFVGSILVQKIDTLLASKPYLALIFYNEDATDGAANWIADGTATTRISQTISANTTLTGGDLRVLVDTGGLTVDLPASPNTGDEIWIRHAGGGLDITVGRNGEDIEGIASDFTLADGEAGTFVYTSSGWWIF